MAIFKPNTVEFTLADQVDPDRALPILAKQLEPYLFMKEDDLVETGAICKKIEAWLTKPHGFVKERFADIHDEILFDRAVTAQLYCPKKVPLTAYTSPALAFVDASGQVCDFDERQSYKRLPSKKEILEYAERVVVKVGSEVPFDIVTQDALSCFQNGRARIGGMPAEPTGQFSSVIVYRHRP
jgi:hypothetical protein